MLTCWAPWAVQTFLRNVCLSLGVLGLCWISIQQRGWEDVGLHLVNLAFVWMCVHLSAEQFWLAFAVLSFGMVALCWMSVHIVHQKGFRYSMYVALSLGVLGSDWLWVQYSAAGCTASPV